MNKLIITIITIFTCLSLFGCAESDFEEFDYCDNEDHYCKIKTTNDLEKDVEDTIENNINENTDEVVVEDITEEIINETIIEEPVVDETIANNEIIVEDQIVENIYSFEIPIFMKKMFVTEIEKDTVSYEVSDKDAVSITFNTLNYAIDIPTVTHGLMHLEGADWQSCLGDGPTSYKNGYLGPLKCTEHRTVAVVNIPIEVNMPPIEDRYLELKAIYFKDTTVRMEFVQGYEIFVF